MKNIYTSPRFWLIIVVATLQSLAVFNVLGGDQVDQLINIISLALGSMVALRTVDKMSENKGQVTTVTMPENVKSVSASTEEK